MVLSLPKVVASDASGRLRDSAIVQNTSRKQVEGVTGKTNRVL